MSHLVTILSRKIKNLLPSFRSWSLHANAVVTEPYKLTLNAVASTYQNTSFLARCAPNTVYSFNIISTAGVGISSTDALGNNLVVHLNKDDSTASVPISFTSHANAVYIKVTLFNPLAASGTFTFTNPQLEIGPVATPFEPQ